MRIVYARRVEQACVDKGIVRSWPLLTRGLLTLPQGSKFVSVTRPLGRAPEGKSPVIKNKQRAEACDSGALCCWVLGAVDTSPAQGHDETAFTRDQLSNTDLVVD